MSITFGNILDMARRKIVEAPQIDSDGANEWWGDYMPDVAHESVRRRAMSVIISDRIEQDEPVYRQSEQKAS